MYIWGGVCNMYTGTLVDVINEATIKAPDRPVANIHHRININAANKGTPYQRTESGMSWLSDREKEGRKAAYKGRLHQHGKLYEFNPDDLTRRYGPNNPIYRDFARHVSTGSGVNYDVK